MFISIIVPIYNEMRCLEANLRTVSEFLRTSLGGGYELLCVDDGSRDGSAQILDGFAAQGVLTVLRHPENRGKGAAVRTGMLAARGDVAFFFDADLSTPLSEMQAFLPLLASGADVVIGTRKTTPARIKKFQPIHRVILGLGYSYLVNLIMGLRISDFTCGFKAFSREAREAVFPAARIDGWSYDVEILYLARRMGYKIVEVPITWADKPGSKVRLVRDTVNSFCELLKIRKLHRFMQAPERSQIPESGIRLGDPDTPGCPRIRNDR